MQSLTRAFPEADALLLLAPEELGGRLIFIIKADLASQPGGQMYFHPQHVVLNATQRNTEPHYGHKAEQVGLAVSEALSWLEAESLIVPKPDDYASGWRVFSRRALAMTGEADFSHFRLGRLLPRELLHPSIAEQVWASFMRGEYDTAAFQAMRQVEILVRERSGIDKLGVKLARAAFKPFDTRSGEVGPLTERELEEGEQQGMMDLFAGALGALKNPHSHRVVLFRSPADAAAVVIFASQLLRIVDSR